MEKYTILSAADADGMVSIRRQSDGMVSRCKLSWLVQVTEKTYQALNNTKAIRLDGLEWNTEG